MWFKYGLKAQKRVCHKSTVRKSVRRINLKNQMKMKRETLKKILNFVITVLTAIASAFCVQSCK